MTDDTTLPEMDDATREFFEFMQRDEPLHPDLLEYYEEDGPIGPMIRHPLVYEIGVHGPARINQRYEAKKKMRDEALAEKDWSQYLWIHERPHRLNALVRVADKMKNGEFWALARDVWIDSENIWQHLDLWLDIFQWPRPGRAQFMTAEERKQLRKLPDELLIYRGCHAGLNDDGLSWTLDKERALWFATRFTRDEAPAVVLVGTAPKDGVHAYLPEGRGEDEVVVRHPEVVQVTRVEYV